MGTYKRLTINGEVEYIVRGHLRLCVINIANLYIYSNGAYKERREIPFKKETRGVTTNNVCLFVNIYSNNK